MNRVGTVLLVIAALPWVESGPPGWKTKELFGYHVEDFDADPLSHIMYSSYVGEVAPLLNKVVDHNEEPRSRARAAFDEAWKRLGRGLVTAQDRVDEDPELPAREEEFVSDQEKPRDVPTRPKYGLPGGWARGELPEQKVNRGFVPIQIYSQTRRYDVEEHLPRSRASEDANTEEELIAAPRLREVLKDTKRHEVYEEEGYEDLGYNHGGYNHHGSNVENGIKDENTFLRRDPNQHYYNPSSIVKLFSEVPPGQALDTTGEGTSGGKKIEPEINTVPSGEIRSAGTMDTAETRYTRIVNGQNPTIIFPGESSSRHYSTWRLPGEEDQYNKEELRGNAAMGNLHKVASYLPNPIYFENSEMSPSQFSSSTPIQFASAINTYASLINQNISTPIINLPEVYSQYDIAPPLYSPIDDYVWASSSIHEVTNTEKPVTGKNEQVDATTTKSTVAIELETSSEIPKRQRKGGRRRGNTRNKNNDTLIIGEDSTSTTAKPYQIGPRNMKVYSNLTRGSVKYNPEDDSQWTLKGGSPNTRHPSLPVDNGDKKEVNPRVHLTTQKTVDGPSPLNISSHEKTTADTSANARYVDQLTLAHYSLPANLSPNNAPNLSEQEERLKELAKLLNAPEEQEQESVGAKRSKRGTPVYDETKYPHYSFPFTISEDSALKYATNLKTVPIKTYGGMEYYESKASFKCRDPPQPKKVAPERDYDGEWDEDPVGQTDGPRVRGVGTAIECYKKKFFGQEPLDNPFFQEDKVDNSDNIESFERSLPRSQIPDQRRSPMVERYPKPAIDGPVARAPYRSSTIRPNEVSITTSYPIQYVKHYQVQEDLVESPRITQQKYKHYYSLHPGKPYHYSEKNHSSQAINNRNRIPNSYIPVPVQRKVRLMPSGKRDVIGSSYRSNYKTVLVKSPVDYVERKIIIRKRETDNRLWDIINPLKWWWPNMFDNRRNEPRYRRSVLEDYPMPDSEEIYDVGSEMVEMVVSDKPITNKPLTMAEFKSKFNISEPKKSSGSARLTGGFLNRNSDIEGVQDMLVGIGPDELSSTFPTTKPKVVFPKPKLPRRKTAYSAKRTGNVPEYLTTEGTTTTTTSTPPPTTTRMYKPKRVIKKNYKVPIDMFTILKTQQDVKTTSKPLEAPDIKETMRTLGGEKDTLMYEVNPSTGVGSWTERKWKPKRKRPNTPSVYSFRKSKEGTKKTQRDIHDPHQQVYVYGLMSKLLNSKLPSTGIDLTESAAEVTSEDNSDKRPFEKVMSLNFKPPPRYILEPDKRRYFYAKVR